MLPIDHWSYSVLESLAAALHVLLALTVTIDVLLKKSDVRAALGWIAAAWLSPIFGSLLYYLFGINRVTRRAMRMARLERAQPRPPRPAELAAPASIAELSEVGMRVTGEPLTAGNALAILEGGDEAYPAMLEAIAGARRSIALISYIFRDDAAGRQFTDALIAAHRRGVRVRVLLDSVGSGYVYSRSLNRLLAAGIRADRFLHTWLPWRMPFLNMRNHRKILVVDGSLAFTGGINIGAENCTRFAAKPIGDVHFRVEGPIVRVVMDAFARDWSFTTDETLEEDCWWPDLKARGPVFARGLRSGPDADLYKLEFILGAALTLARKRVRIVTPYFLPDPRLQFAIAQAGLRGVEVEIVLPERSDQHLMQWAMRGHLRFFRHIRAGIFITPPPFDHSKLCTVDGEWSLVGSSNWDARSFRLNFEFDLECIDRDLTARIDALIDTKIARAKPLTPAMLAAEPVWVKLRNAATRLMMPYL
ncbi:MAG TPA: phospholipase D-like domain-containing protein [Rhizomicrobium sp.]|nr:phospholipase D-like domain-containing protein [Rhizomicrobium sp.]